MKADPRLKEIAFRPEGPQPLVREIAPGASYPVHALGPLRPAVEAVQGMTLPPVAIPAQSALGIAALAVQGFADVETLGGPRPVSLYALTIAKSGERKSACDAQMMAGLRDHEKQQASEVRSATESWCNRHALWKGERDRILGDAVGPNDPAVDASYELFADTLAHGVKALAEDTESTSLGSCQAIKDPTTNTDLPAERQIKTDDTYVIRAWQAVIIYLLSDYKFLYE